MGGWGHLACFHHLGLGLHRDIHRGKSFTSTPVRDILPWFDIAHKYDLIKKKHCHTFKITSYEIDDSVTHDISIAIIVVQLFQTTPPLGLQQLLLLLQISISVIRYMTDIKRGLFQVLKVFC